MRSGVSSRFLCSRCLQSFDSQELTGTDSNRTCFGCARLAARRPATRSRAPEPRFGWWTSFLRDASDWAVGRSWLLRAPVLVYLGYVLVRHVGEGTYQSLFKPLNLGVHELGHVVFGPFGELLAMAGGSLLQCLVPILGLAMFIRQRDYFAIAFGLGWLGTNLFDVAVYAGDARSMSLPLVSPFSGHPRHDWNYLLGQLGMLHLDSVIETLLRAFAIIVMTLGLAGGGWLLAKMVRAPGNRDAI